MGAVCLLPEDPDEAAETLRAWPQRFGVYEVLVAVDLLDAFAPVLARLRVRTAHGRRSTIPGWRSHSRR